MGRGRARRAVLPSVATVAFDRKAEPNHFERRSRCRLYPCWCRSESCQQVLHEDTLSLERCVCSGDGDCEITPERVTARTTTGGTVTVSLPVDVLAGDWHYLSFDWEVLGGFSVAVLVCSLATREETRTLQVFTSFGLLGAGPVDSGLIDIREFGGQEVVLSWSLESAMPDAAFVIGNCRFWRDPREENEPPECDLETIVRRYWEAGEDGKASVELSCDPEHCRDPEGGDLGYLWLVDGEFVADEASASVTLEVGTHVVALCLEDAVGQQVCEEREIEVVVGPRRFVRGDVNQSGGLNLTDGVQILLHLFDVKDLPGPLGCLDAADADDSGSLELTDGVSVFLYLFRDGAIPVPSPATAGSTTAADPGDCASDPTEDDLDCEKVPEYCQ